MLFFTPPFVLALVVIAKNEERCIERCLASARPHVDKMLVLDTGSSDRTVAIAQACGAQVHHMEWPGDFSVARNRSLALADADWHLVLDADEWLEEGTPWLASLKTQTPDFLGVVTQRSDCQTAQGAQEARTQVTRLLPRGAHYTGRVHEQAVGEFPRHLTPLVLGHDGYATAQMQRKKGRNLVLLQQEAQARPRDPYVQYQLGVEFELSGAFSQACQHYQAARECLQGCPSYKHSLVVRHLYCLGQAGLLEQALILAGDEMGQWDHSPDYFFVLGNLFLDAAVQNPIEHRYWLDMASSAWQRCLEIGEQPHLSGSVTGRGSFLAQKNLAIINGETCY